MIDTKKMHFIIPYISGLLLMALFTFVVYPLKEFLGLVNIALLYLLPVLFSSAKWGTGPSLISASIGIIIFDIFYVPPVFRFTVADLRYLISFFIFLLVGLITGTLSTKLKNQVRLSLERENRISALYALSKEVTAVTNLEFCLKSIIDNVAKTIHGGVRIYLPTQNRALTLSASNCEGKVNIDEEEMSIATWVFEHCEIAGRDTLNFGNTKGIFLPMYTDKEIQGVLVVRKDSERFEAEQIKLLEAFASFTAMAINRIKLSESAREALTFVESERLRTALFNSLSHDLRTPLSSIIGAVTGLLEDDNVYNADAKRDLLIAIQQGANRMNRFITNLLDMAKMESGMLKLKKEWCDIQDIVGVAIGRMGEVLHNRIRVNIEANLPLIKGDFILVEQVIINLLDNAIKYSAQGSEIFINVTSLQQEIEIAVTDQGQTIPFKDLDKIFDKFYRLKSPLQVSGTGLGLAICKGIVEAHGGQIRAENNIDSGVTISFTLPIKDEYSKLIPYQIEDEMHG